MGAQRSKTSSTTAQRPAQAVSADVAVLRLSRELRRARQDAARYRRRWSRLRDGLRRLLEQDFADDTETDTDLDNAS